VQPPRWYGSQTDSKVASLVFNVVDDVKFGIMGRDYEAYLRVKPSTRKNIEIG